MNCEVAKEMEVLLKSRGYGIKSVFGMYLETCVMLVIKGRDLDKVRRDFTLIKDIHSIEIVEELDWDDVDLDDPMSEAPLVDVLKCRIDYKE